MRCIDVQQGAHWGALAVLSLLAACSSSELPPAASPSSPSRANANANANADDRVPVRVAAVSPVPGAGGKPVAPVLPALPPARTWNELRRQAALRIVAANPAGTYTDDVIEPLLAIPVLEIELNRDGSIHRILVLREPSQAKDTTSVAIAAVRRAAPFGEISRLPKPWRFTETFLFNSDRKFKPRTLDP